MTDHSDRWDPHFLSYSPVYAVLRPVAERFTGSAAWPDLDAFNAMARDLRLVTAQGHALTFVQALPKPRGSRRRLIAQATQPRYEERIYHQGAVPTRLNNWHDFFNALVWATFPHSKAALNQRQILVHDDNKPRGREQDRLAMFDEGGIIQLRSVEGELSSLVFGHALFEACILKHQDIYGMVYENLTSESFTALKRSAKLEAVDSDFAQFIMNGQLWRPDERPTRALLSTLNVAVAFP